MRSNIFSYLYHRPIGTNLDQECSFHRDRRNRLCLRLGRFCEVVLGEGFLDFGVEFLEDGVHDWVIVDGSLSHNPHNRLPCFFRHKQEHSKRQKYPPVRNIDRRGIENGITEWMIDDKDLKQNLNRNSE